MARPARRQPAAATAILASAVSLLLAGTALDARAAPDVTIDSTKFLQQAAMFGFDISKAILSCVQDSDSGKGGFIAVTLFDPVTGMPSTTVVNEECGPDDGDGDDGGDGDDDGDGGGDGDDGDGGDDGDDGDGGDDGDDGDGGDDGDDGDGDDDGDDGGGGDDGDDDDGDDGGDDDGDDGGGDDGDDGGGDDGEDDGGDDDDAGNNDAAAKSETTDALVAGMMNLRMPKGAVNQGRHNFLRNLVIRGGLLAMIQKFERDREEERQRLARVHREAGEDIKALNNGAADRRKNFEAKEQALQNFIEQNPRFAQQGEQALKLARERRFEFDNAMLIQLDNIAGNLDNLIQSSERLAEIEAGLITPEAAAINDKFDEFEGLIDDVYGAADAIRGAEEQIINAQRKQGQSTTGIAEIQQGLDGDSAMIRVLENRLDSVETFPVIRQYAPVSAGPDSLRFGFDLHALHAFAGANRPPTAERYGILEDDFDRRWNAFVTGSLSGFSQGSERDGLVGDITAGVGYLLTDRIAAGGFLTYARGDIDSSSASAQLTADFLGGGVFVNARVGDLWLFDGLLSYEHGWNDISISGATGDFSIDALTVSGSLTRRTYLRPYTWVAPNLSVSYAFYDRSGYTDSTGTAVPGSDLQHGRLTAGSSIGHTVFYDDGNLRRVDWEGRASFVWDFVNGGDFQLAGGALAKSADIGGALGGSVTALFRNGMRASASFDFLAQDKDFYSYSGSVNFTVPF